MGIQLLEHVPCCSFEENFCRYFVNFAGFLKVFFCIFLIATDLFLLLNANFY
jgi:hypothetical protein